MWLQTPRLTIRQFELSDAAGVLAFYGDAETMRWLSYVRPWATTEAEAEALIGRTREYYRTHPGYGIFAAERHAQGLAGHALLKPLDSGEVEVGWVLDPNLRGLGLATEIGEAMVRYGFETLGLPSIIALMYPHNDPSRRVAERLGMVYQGERMKGEHLVAWYRMELGARS